MTWATSSWLRDCTVIKLSKKGLCKWEMIWKNTVIWMAEENTEFEKARQTSWFFLERQDINRSIFCIIYNWCVVNNHYFPNQKWHLVKTGKVCGIKSTAATQRPHRSGKSKILEPVFFPGLHKLGQRTQLNPCWMSFFFANWFRILR